LLRIFPVTVALATAVTAIDVLNSTVLHAHYRAIVDHVGLDLEAVKAGRLWTMPAATLIQTDLGLRWQVPVLVLFVLGSVGLLEYLVGSVPALVTFFLSDWISAPLTALVLWGLGSLGSDTARTLAHSPGVGSSAAAFGAVVAAAVLLPRPWREAVLTGLFGYLIVQFTFEQLDDSIAHLLAALIGAAFGLLWRWHPAAEATLRFSAHRRQVTRSRQEVERPGYSGK
jgi:hypothetical protein